MSTNRNNLYYVYWKWSRPDNSLRSDWGRWLLAFESRQKADEFYRAMQDLKNADGKTNRFTLLHRSTAQFWCFDTTEGDAYYAPQRILEGDPTWNFNVQLCLLNDVGGRDWPIIDNVNDGTDWLNGGSFFIRCKRNEIRNQYWYWNGSFIETSTIGRTKFVVRATGMDPNDPQVMIRSDKITIELAGTSGGSNVQYVVPGGSDSFVSVSGSRYEWTFGDFFASFGTGVPSSNSTSNAIVFSPPISDDWELV